MGLFKRGAVYYVDVKDAEGKRHVKTTGTTDLEEARAFESDLRQHLASALSQGTTLQEAVEWTYKTVWQHNRSGLQSKMQADQAVVFFSPDKRVGAITAQDLAAYRAHLAEGRTPTTVNRYMAAIRTVLNTMVRRGEPVTVPYVPMAREAPHRIRVVTQEEEARILELAPEPYRSLIVVLVDTGLRLSEALRLNSQDYHADTQSISIWVTKADRPRTVPCTSRVRAILEKAKGPVFPDITVCLAEHAWKKVRREMGLVNDSQFVLHALRHTCASRLVRGGVSLYVVKEWLGHASIKTTERYAHLSTAALRAGVAVLEQ